MTLSPSLFKATILFPFNVMGSIPVLILWFTGKFQLYQFEIFFTFVGGLLVLVGLYICWVTVSLFTDYGQGTPAPWAPPKNLVMIGIYRYMRNPMMIGVWLVLIGEASIFMSAGILLWFLLFFVGSIILIPLWEEVDLENRFGNVYHSYKKEVPRWIPTIKL